MISRLRLAASLLLAVVTVFACTAGGSSSFNSRPADIYAITPTQFDIQTLLGDANWWESPPSFEVLPLDSATRSATERFSLSVRYRHIGTAEELLARYTVYETTSSASTAMTDYQALYGPSPASGAKVGDQVLYYGMAGSGGAPLLYRTFVRVGQVVVQIAWARKDKMASTQVLLNQLAKNARQFTSGLKTLSKVHAKTESVNARFLPPAGLDITLLGSATMSIEAFSAMIDAALPGPVTDIQKRGGARTFAYGDYALNNDTHMEVQTAMLALNSAADAQQWAALLDPGTPNNLGVSWAYIPTGGTPGAGVYHYVFSAGVYGLYMVCKSSVDGEAATRECEDPMDKTARAWLYALGA